MSDVKRWKMTLGESERGPVIVCYSGDEQDVATEHEWERHADAHAAREADAKRLASATEQPCPKCGKYSVSVNVPCQSCGAFGVTMRDAVDRLLAERKGCDLPQCCCEWCGVAKEARFERDCIREVLDSMMAVVCRPLNLTPASVSENDVRAGIDSFIQERDALRAELVAVLRESVKKCAVWPRADGATIDTLGQSGYTGYAAQIRRLASLGQVDIISDDGDRVVARWRKE